MIDRIIIAEDHESSNLSIEKTIGDLQIEHSDYVFYCDDALRRINHAIQQGSPYDLLITDLYFDDDGSVQKLKTGFELIRAAREAQPGIMILVFSGEDRPPVIEKLFREYEIDGYVRKARHDIRELKNAFEAFSKHQQYYPHTLRTNRHAHTHEFTTFDITVIRLISQGHPIKEMPSYLQKHAIRPCSLSSIEKRLKEIREEFGFSKNEQLVLFCKESGIL